jgi:hypothetical protein
MQREMKTLRTIANQAGTISDRLRLTVKVRFDLIETQDFVDGVPDLEFSYGNLRFSDESEPQVLPLIRCRNHLTLQGGGIQTTIRLNGPTAFTVTSSITECDWEEEVEEEEEEEFAALLRVA